MTTNRSLPNPMRFTFKQGLKSITAAVAVILCGVTAFLTTLYTLAELFSKTPVFDDNGIVTGYSESKDLYHFIIFPDAEYMSTVLLIIIAAGGVLAAICSFNFITSKKMVNVYYSLGITRTKLFCGKYLSGLLLLFIAIFIPMLLIFIGNIAALGFSASMFKAVMFYFLNFICIAFTSYTITSAVFAAVGTTFETAIFSAIILFIPDIFLYSVQALMDKFLYGNPYGNNFVFANEYYYTGEQGISTLPQKFSFLSPVFWGKKQLVEFSLADKQNAKDAVPEISPNFVYALIWLAVCIAVFFLAVLLFNKRKAEICGFIGTNRYLNSAVSLLAAFAAFCVIISNFEDLIAGIALGALAFAIVHLVLEIIVLRDLKKFVRGLYKLPIGIVVSIAIVFLFSSGLFGYSQKIPDISDIKSVAVTYVGTNNEYGLFSDNYYYFSCDYRYYGFSNSLSGEFTTANDIKAVVEAHEVIANTDESDRTLENEIQFIYTLKDGSTVMRSFNAVSPEGYKKVLYLEDCDYYDEVLKDYFKGKIREFKDWDDSKEYVFSSAQKNLRDTYTVNVYSKYIDKVFTVNLSESDKAKLLGALYTDIVNRSAQEKYYPDESPVAFVNFLYGEGAISSEDAPEQSEISEAAFSAIYSEFNDSSPWMPYFSVYVTTDMTNTIQLLKDMGLYEKVTAAPEFVSAEIVDARTAYDATIGKEDYLSDKYSRLFLGNYSATKSTNPNQDWTWYDSMLDSLVEGTVVKDEHTIAELMKCSYTVYEQDDTDKGWFVSFKTADGSTALCYIPEGKLPAGVK